VTRRKAASKRPSAPRRKKKPGGKAGGARFTLDHLEPSEFEAFCQDLLDSMGFVNIRWKKGTGLPHSPSDSGRDIECSYPTVDVDGERKLERWLVECKRQVRGVPPAKIRAAVAWAEAERPDRLLIIASNFLSKGAWDWIRTYQAQNRPPFQIKVWERPQLESFVAQAPDLLSKYRIPQESLLRSHWHPAHIQFVQMPFRFPLQNVLHHTDQLPPYAQAMMLERVGRFLEAREPSEPKATETPIRERLDRPFDYGAFRRRCLRLAKSLDARFLGFAIVNEVVRHLAYAADPLLVPEKVQLNHQIATTLEGELERRVPDDSKRRVLEENIRTFHQRTADTAFYAKTYRHAYMTFCNEVLVPLMREELAQRFEAPSAEIQALLPVVDVWL
jgi:Restriction endonuclease